MVATGLPVQFSYGEKLRDSSPSSAGRPIENVQPPVVQDRSRGSGFVPWRIDRHRRWHSRHPMILEMAHGFTAATVRQWRA